MTITETRTAGRVLRLTVPGGLLLAVLQPVPFALVLAVNRAAKGTGTDESAVATFWGDPISWLAVAAFTAALTVMLARVGRPSGAYVGATMAVSLCAYLAVVAIVPAVLARDPVAVVYLLGVHLGVYGTPFVCLGVAALICWWARDRT